MPTFGQSPGFASFNFVDSLGGSNQVATGLLTFNANGWVTAVNVYVSGDGSTQTLNGCVWNSGSGLIQSASFSAASGSRSVGGQAWHSPGLSGFFLANGTQIRIGWTKANSGGTEVWSCGGSNAGGIASGGNPGSLGTISAFPNGLGGQCGAYITYTTVAAPTAITNAASSVASTTATLNGTVNPQGLNTTYYFQYGTTTSYGTNTANQNTGTNGSSFSNVPATASLTGLSAGQTYHFRLVASNSVGTTYGADQQLTTLGLPTALLASPLDKTYASIWQNGETFAWTYQSNGAAGGQTAYAFRVSIDPVGNQFWWWAGSAWSTTETWITSSASSLTIGASNWVGTYPTGLAGQTTGRYYWWVAVQDANGRGAYNPPYPGGYFTLNNEIPPAAPSLTAPANGTYADLASTPTFSWAYQATNAQGGQTAVAGRRKISGSSSYNYWNAGTLSWASTVPIWNATASQSFTFPAAAWTNGNVYNWSIATQDAGGQGPWAADFAVTAQAAPTVSVTAPTGLVASQNPTVLWTATFPSGASETAYQVRTFTATQYGIGGFNPSASPASDDSGVVGLSSVSYQVATNLIINPATVYRSYVNVTETGNETNGFNAFTQYTVSADTPNAPALTATSMVDGVTGYSFIQLQAQCEINLLSAVDSSFESGVGTYAPSNCSIAQSAAQFLDGSFSLALTNTSAGTEFVRSGFYAVAPSTQYAFALSMRAATTGRSIQATISWYDASHTYLGFDTLGTAASDVTTGWTQMTVGAVSPSNAAFVTVGPTISSVALGEVHYLDNVGLFPNTNIAWSLGGFLSTAGVIITRSDGAQVRLASSTNPALLSNAPVNQLVTVNDYEATGLVAYTYTAQIVATGLTGVVNSPSSAPVGASISFSGFWEIDPTNYPSAINANPITWNPQQFEQGAVHPVMGQLTANYVAYAMQNPDFMATFETFNPAVYNGLLALVVSQKTVFINTPFGTSGYYRLAPAPGGMSGGTGTKAHDSQLFPSTASSPHYTLGITGIAQPRPPV